MSAQPAFLTKTLSDMTDEEWESLCDGCGLCCQHRANHPVSGEEVRSNVACRCLDLEALRCTDYAMRTVAVPFCVQLTPENIHSLSWLPDSCAYKRVAQGEGLPEWHHLICGDREEVHRRGISKRGQLMSDSEVVKWLQGGREKDNQPPVRFYGLQSSEEIAD